MKIKEFFYFQKSDRQVLIVLVGVAAFFMSLAYFLRPDEMGENSTSVVDSLSYRRQQNYPRHAYNNRSNQQYYAVPETAVERFPFDPNTADSTQFLRLGLQPWQIRNIYKYRARGGIYRKPTDFARLYGLTLKQYRELEPYIRISDDYRPAAEYYHEETTTMVDKPTRDTVRYPYKISAGEHVLLNDADTNSLKTVPGIGSAYARAIIRYGERLGGYHDVRQLLEINGFPEEVVAYFSIAQKPIRKLNVNKLTLEQLRKHPYLGFYRAKAIVEYRRLHGPITRLEELYTTGLFPQELIEKLQPYVAF